MRSENGTILLDLLVRKRYYFGENRYYMIFGNTAEADMIILSSLKVG